MARAGQENFTVASLVLPRRQRRHLLALYGFARLVDDVGDEAAGDRLATLDWLERDLERAYGGRAEHPLMRALTPTLHDCSLPDGPLRRLIEANRQDQRVGRYERFEDLVAYCHLSADPVGELVLHVFGLATPERIGQSDAVCTALQVIEHLQDVLEDNARGRIYLPAEDLRRFAVSEADLVRAPAPAAVRELIEFQARRARALMGDGAPALIAGLRGRARVAIAGFVGGGEATLDAIATAGHDVSAGPPRASRGARAAATMRALRGRRR
jgi:squalene synthase HpnC